MGQISPLLFDNKHYVQKIEVVELQINKVAPPPSKKIRLVIQKELKFFHDYKAIKKAKKYVMLFYACPKEHSNSIVQDIYEKLNIYIQ